MQAGGGGNEDLMGGGASDRVVAGGGEVGKCCGGYFDQDSCHQVYFKPIMQRTGAHNRRLRVV